MSVLTSPEQYKLVSKALPQPHFDGKPDTWEDFKRKFRMWFKMTQLGPEFEGIILVNLLPEKDGAMFLQQLEKGLALESLWKALNLRYGALERYSLRERWYARRCELPTLRDFETFLLTWTNDLQELKDVSAEEEKQTFLRALPPDLQHASSRLKPRRNAP